MKVEDKEEEEKEEDKDLQQNYQVLLSFILKKNVKPWRRKH